MPIVYNTTDFSENNKPRTDNRPTINIGQDRDNDPNDTWKEIARHIADPTVATGTFGGFCASMNGSGKRFTYEEMQNIPNKVFKRIMETTIIANHGEQMTGKQWVEKNYAKNPEIIDMMNSKIAGIQNHNITNAHL